MKELTSLHEQLVNKTQELQVCRTNSMWQHVPLIQKSLLLCGTELDKAPLWVKPRALESFKGQGGLFSSLEHNHSVFVSTSLVFILTESHLFPLLTPPFSTDNTEYLAAEKTVYVMERNSRRKAGC